MKNIQKIQQQLRKRRAHRVRASLVVTVDRPRLSVFRSLKHISAQIIAPGGRVLVAASDTSLKGTKKMTGVAKAQATGTLLAEAAQAKKIKRVVFDKSHYQYHGRVKALADAARAAGLEF